MGFKLSAKPHTKKRDVIRPTANSFLSFDIIRVGYNWFYRLIYGLVYFQLIAGGKFGEWIGWACLVPEYRRGNVIL